MARERGKKSRAGPKRAIALIGALCGLCSAAVLLLFCSSSSSATSPAPACLSRSSRCCLNCCGLSLYVLARGSLLHREARGGRGVTDVDADDDAPSCLVFWACGCALERDRSSYNALSLVGVRCGALDVHGRRGRECWYVARTHAYTPTRGARFHVRESLACRVCVVPRHFRPVARVRRCCCCSCAAARVMLFVDKTRANGNHIALVYSSAVRAHSHSLSLSLRGAAGRDAAHGRYPARQRRASARAAQHRRQPGREDHWWLDPASCC